MFLQRISVILAAGALMVLVASAPAPGDEVSAAPETTATPAPVAVFVGDSYTSGTGAASSASRWSTLASQSLGWTERNLALSGTGYLAGTDSRPGLTCERPMCPSFPELLEQLRPSSVDIVVVAGGINDARFLPSPTAGIGEAVSRTLDDICTAFPGAQRVVVLAPFWPDGTWTPDLEAVRQTIQRLSAARGFAYIADAASWLTATTDDLDPDGLHPNDRGHAALASRFVDAIERLQRDSGTPDGGCPPSATRSAS